MVKVSNRNVEAGRFGVLPKIPHITMSHHSWGYWSSGVWDLDLKAREFCIKLNEQRDNPSTKGA